MTDRGLKIIGAILWLVFSTLQIISHTLYMVQNETIDWHLAFVIVFAVLFGCWAVLLVDYICDSRK